MLADQLVRLMEREAPDSVALVGCAGGNGLERLPPGNPIGAAAAAAGFTARDSHTIELGSGKPFWLQTFRAGDPVAAGQRSR
jgi:hypothetical protein